MWAAEREAGGAIESLRLENRHDIARCRKILPLFVEPWWGVVVYSCFDSVIGVSVVAKAFREPIPPHAAESALAQISFPPSSVQHHRAQSTLTGARRSIVSACEKAEGIHEVLCSSGRSFDDRFSRLRALRVSWWGRTTCFDVLVRAGCLGVAKDHYRPEKAHLLGSTGPSAGFANIWGETVTKSTEASCEELLHRWTALWSEVAEQAGVEWSGRPYDSADLENALCVFQEPPVRASRSPKVVGESIHHSRAC